MTKHNREYYAFRAATERAKAAACSNSDVAAVHDELANMYEKRVLAETIPPTLRVVAA
jgi:hypothetical protein